MGATRSSLAFTGDTFRVSVRGFAAEAMESVQRTRRLVQYDGGIPRRGNGKCTKDTETSTVGRGGGFSHGKREVHRVHGD